MSENHALDTVLDCLRRSAGVSNPEVDEIEGEDAFTVEAIDEDRELLFMVTADWRVYFVAKCNGRRAAGIVEDVPGGCTGLALWLVGFDFRREGLLLSSRSEIS